MCIRDRDTIHKLLYDAVFGTFLQEFLQRILIFTVTMLFVAGIFNLHQLIIAYSAAVCAKGLVLFVYLLFKGEEMCIRDRLPIGNYLPVED